jgi:hypothetical protein
MTAMNECGLKAVFRHAEHHLNRDAGSQRHRSISMVREAHEDASWRFSVFPRRKLLLKSRDPIKRDRVGDLTIACRKVNAINKIRESCLNGAALRQ